MGWFEMIWEYKTQNKPKQVFKLNKINANSGNKENDDLTKDLMQN